MMNERDSTTAWVGRPRGAAAPRSWEASRLRPYQEELRAHHGLSVIVIRLPVVLELDERHRYDRLVRPLVTLRRSFFRRHRRAIYEEMLRAVGSTEEGRAAIADYSAAVELAGFPKAKRALVRALLWRHRAERTIVFTARVEDAYRVAEQTLVAVITREVGTRERERVLARLRDGRLRAIASPHVLNEEIEVPDARVAIVVSGSLGVREHVRRIALALRPSPGKKALVYELVTEGTLDEPLARPLPLGGIDAAAV